MILIFSTKNDVSTNDVVDWLVYYKKDFIRIDSEESLIEEINIEFLDGKLTVNFVCNGRLINLESLKSVWFRRGGFKLIINTLTKIKVLNNILHYNIHNEYKTLTEFLYNQLILNAKCLGNPFLMNTNKLDTLYIASQNGLRIPNTFITNEKICIEKYLNNSKCSLITKAIQDNIGEMYKSNYIHLLTNKFHKKNLTYLSNKFFPSLFQEEIKKVCELRIFYLDGIFYTASIFSQKNEKTKIDFRNYDWNNPNRISLFKLPLEIKLKLKKVFKKLKLNTGSVDMIVNEYQEYIFLEINPVGQYGMVSIPLNLNIDKKIAEWLCK